VELKGNENLYLNSPILLTPPHSHILITFFLYRSLPPSQEQSPLCTQHHTQTQTTSSIIVIVFTIIDQSSQPHFQHVGTQHRVQWYGKADTRVQHTFHNVGLHSRSQISVGGRISDSAHCSHFLRAFHGLHAVPRTPRRHRTGGGFVGHSLRQHHRLLGSLGTLPGNGTPVLPSLRSKASQASLSHAPTLRSLLNMLLNPHFTLVAQHVQNLPYTTPRHENHKNGAKLPPLPPPRPRHQLLPPPNQSLPSSAERHPTGHVSFPRRHAPPRRLQLRSRETRGGRSRRRLRRLQLFDSGTVAPLCVDKWGPPRHVECAEPRVFYRLGAAASAGCTELRVRLFGVVVVWDHDLVMRTPCGAHCQRGGYGDFNPNDVVDLRLSFVPGVGRVNARG